MDYHTWSVVAQYVPAHPQQFTLLSQVNRMFYRIFMSDKLWTKLDFYDVREAISEHYLATSLSFTDNERSQFRTKLYGNHNSWISPRTESGNARSSCVRCGHLDYDHFVTAELRSKKLCKRCYAIFHLFTSNKYVQFLAAANYSRVMTTFILAGYTGRAKQILIEEHGVLRCMDEKDLQDLEMVRRCLVANPLALGDAPPYIQRNFDLACVALRGDSLVYQFLEASVRKDPRIYRTCMQSLRKHIDTSSLFSS